MMKINENAANELQLNDGRLIPADDSVNHMDIYKFITDTMKAQDRYIRKCEVITQIVMKIDHYTFSKAVLRITGDQVEVDVYSRKTSMDPIFQYSCCNNPGADMLIDNLIHFYRAAEVSTRKIREIKTEQRGDQ